jgi:methyl-accepting chemotaxis protein/methyl-accepting chemotaxis protein-1 (serine sensor receptor)
MNYPMTIGRRFTLTSGILLLLSAALALVSLLTLSAVQTNVRALSNGSVPGLVHSSGIRGDLLKVRGDYLLRIGQTDPAEATKAEGKVLADTARLTADMKVYEAGILSDADRRNFDQLTPEVAAVQTAWDKALLLCRASQNAAAIAVYNAEITPHMDLVKAGLESIVLWNNQAAETTIAATNRGMEVSRWLTLVLAIAAVVLGIGLSWLMIAGLNHDLSKSVQELADGSHQIASAAAQVSTASQVLAQGAAQSVASVEETAASLEQIGLLVRNTSNSGAMSLMVAESQQEFVATNQHLTELVTAMEQINESGASISKIIKVIEEIAFQTNILALNASVEAARAGQAGLGFAVVADEVRNLSQRCAQAAKDTTDLIEQSVERSGRGREKVQRMNASLSKITADFTRIKSLVDEVTQGSKEQSNGISQIRQAIIRIEDSSQNTAATAEQSAAAAEQLNSQSESMLQVVQHLTHMAGLRA